MVPQADAPPTAHRVRRGAARALVVALAVVGLAAAGCGSDSAGQGSSGKLEGFVRDQPLQVGDITVPQVAEDGTETPFTFKAPKGELLFSYFGYTNCPDICPTTLADLRKALAKLGPDAAKVSAAFMTVDPSRDTGEVMVPYLASFVKDGHPLRSTDDAVLKKAEDAFGASSSINRTASGGYEVSHSTSSYIVDDKGEVAVEWAFGTPADVMAKDLQVLLDRAEEQSS